MGRIPIAVLLVALLINALSLAFSFLPTTSTRPPLSSRSVLGDGRQFRCSSKTLLGASSLIASPLSSSNNATDEASMLPQNEEEEEEKDQPSRWYNVISTKADALQALDEMLDNLPHKNNNKNNNNDDDDDHGEPDVAFLFVSQFHGSAFTAVVQEAARRLPSHTRLLSAVGSGVIGQDCELEEASKPSMSLLLGHGIREADGDDDDDDDDNNDLQVFDFNELHKPPPDANSEYWQHLRRGHDNQNKNKDDDERTTCVLMFADPWSPVENVTTALGPKAIVAGGISVPTGAGPTVALDGRALPQGSLVGVRLPRTLQLQIVTAQGCRPVAEAYTITAAEGSCILELNGEPALQVLERVVKADAKRPLTGLMCGIQATTSNGIDNNNDDDDYNNEIATTDNKDYLIRQIVGYVPTKGGIAVAGGGFHTGDCLRFHVRDKQAAQQDLQLMVQRVQTERSVFGPTPGRVVCGLQISCVARGRSFFGRPNVDLEQTKVLMGPDGGPIAGFYANGELGPVGIAGFTPSSSGSGGGSFQKSHIHGFTTVMAYLCDTTNSATNHHQEVEPVLAPLVDDPTAWG